MRWLLVLMLGLLAGLAGCKKDDNSPQGPAAPPDTWVRVLQNDSTAEYAMDAAEMADGGYVLVGSRTGQPAGNYMVRVDALGNPLWSHTFAVDGNGDNLNSVVTLPGGDILAVGRFRPSNSSTEEALLVRVNSSGGVVWQRATNTDAGFAGFDIAPLTDGNFMVATLGGLAKITFSGDTVWTLRTGSEYLGVTGMPDGGAMAVGTYYRDTENASAMIVRCSAAGDTLWTRELPMAGRRVTPWAVAKTGDGDYFVAGSWSDFPSSWDQAAWAAKISESGQVRWSTSYTEDADFEDVAVGADGLPVTAGGVVPGGQGHEGDILLTKLDYSGNVVWSKSYLSGNTEYGFGITTTSDGGFLVSGIIDGVVGSDIILLKVDADGEL